jgi:hypothetical protein
MKGIYFILICFLMILFSSNCSKETGDDLTMLDEKISKFVETDIKYDTTLLDGKQSEVVENLYYAAKIMDEIFLDQVYSKNREIHHQLEASTETIDQKRLKLFNIMFGPFDRLNHDEPFYGDHQKPLGANFYPEDMTKQEFLQWLEAYPEQEKAFTSEFTVIRRSQNGQLTAIPYSVYYQTELKKAVAYLKQAAESAENLSLKNYLITRADAFLSNDYYQSDMAWMDLKDHRIEVVIGPYEVYEDALFNYKAAFECFITLRDPEESDKLARFGTYLIDIEKHLPIPDKYKNFDRGLESPIVVAQEVFSAGDTKAGVQTIAFNLPNDERVRQAKGSKKVMLKNVSEAKFNKLLLPIAQKILDNSQLNRITFEAFFNHTLMHEISHGVGPGFITVNGRETEVKKELKETYSTIEECKADILGMYNNLFMIEKGEFPASFEQEVWSTFLAGIFRSVRFGISEAHGSGNAIIFNFLLEKGGYLFDQSSEKVMVNFDKIYPTVEELATLLLTIEAEGDYQAAQELLQKYAILSTPMEILIAKLSDLPVDIKPVYQIENEFIAR